MSVDRAAVVPPDSLDSLSELRYCREERFPFRGCALFCFSPVRSQFIVLGSVIPKTRLSMRAEEARVMMLSISSC